MLVVGTGVKASSDLSIADRSSQFDRVEMQMGMNDSNVRAVVVGSVNAYRKFFSPFQTRAQVAKLSNSDIALLFRAASEAHFYTEDPAYVRDMQLDLNALRERGRASQRLYIELNEALIGSRLFSQARMLERAHPGKAVEVFHTQRGDISAQVRMVSVPDVRDDTRGRPGPTEMVLSADGRLLVRRTVETDAPAQIIVVISPSCHFADAGLHEIEADPELRKAFQNRTTWLVPSEYTEFEALARWNREHPYETMSLAYTTREWPMLDDWETPTFYFLKKGAVVAKVVGWPREGRKPEIRSALKRIGFL
jgi:hypothetical protein